MVITKGVSLLLSSEKLVSLYKKYNIVNLPFGIVGDKLGDLYEEFIVDILNNLEYLNHFNNNTSCDSFEYAIFKEVLTTLPKNNLKILSIKANTDIESRFTGGLPKTDVIADIRFHDNSVYSLPISVKQTTASKVALAEFDVETISKEVGITDPELIRLLTKHQTDGSAKNLSSEEKLELKNRLAFISRKFVRWVLTGAPAESKDLRIPKLIVKFKILKPSYFPLSYEVLTIDEAIDNIMLDKRGNIKSGGFGTGLSWTYATGSKGRKIQFKG